jgi:hypothetical protein
MDIRKVPFPPERHGPDHHSIPPMTPGGRGHSCPPTRNSRARPTARRTSGLSPHVFRVRLLRLPGDFARAAKSAGRLTFRPSGNSIKRELIRPPRPSITKRVPTGNRSGRPTLLPLTRPSYTTQRVQTYTLMNCPFVAKRRPASKVAVYCCGRQPGLVGSYRLLRRCNFSGAVCLSSHFFNFGLRSPA